MSPANPRRVKRRCVRLTRADIDAIIIYEMGWEPIDAVVFWRLARRCQQQRQARKT